MKQFMAADVRKNALGQAMHENMVQQELGGNAV
jgi:hypothetical protein